MNKLDLVKENPSYYKASAQPQVVELNAFNYLSILGVGAPEGEQFLHSVEAIYGVAYTIKKHCKAMGKDFGVPKMEGQWWVESGLPYDETPRDQWHWNVMLMMPGYVDAAMRDQAVEEVKAKKELAPVNQVKLGSIKEGKSVQALHLGAYEEEGPTIKKILDFMGDHALDMNGYHHEIYLSDPRRTPKERLKTIIRYPVK